MAKPPGTPKPHGDTDSSGSPRRVPSGDAQSLSHAQDITGQAANLGRPPSQRALPPGSTSRTLSQIRNTKDKRKRWQRAEEYVREMYGGGSESHYPVATNSDPDFPVSTTGGRKVDVPVESNGRTVAVEVKMYQQYRTVEVAPGQNVTHQVEVPLSSHIREQINKDVALRRSDPNYDPRWAFLNAGPSQELRDYLAKAGIIFLEYH
ncbi:hypothetical protein [Micromonospora vulcania]|uniref:Tox-REase-7 domain-containing protein n=1 Tax=Micromonospora vulcania TaxID=1441873 RepID=A0ABW1H5R6_9ACTN